MLYNECFEFNINVKNRITKKYIRKSNPLLLICAATIILTLNCSIVKQPPLNTVFFEQSKGRCIVKLSIDTTTWLGNIEVTNLSDTTGFIFPRFTNTPSTNRITKEHKLKLYNFNNHSSIIFPVLLSELKSNEHVNVKIK